jgi:hypothetical protein
MRAPGKAFWNPALITIGIGILVAVVSFSVVTSQWGHPTTDIATARLLRDSPWHSDFRARMHLAPG